MKFHPLVQEWFQRSFASATQPQELAWNEISAGRDVLISAPTGRAKPLLRFCCASIGWFEKHSMVLCRMKQKLYTFRLSKR